MTAVRTLVGIGLVLFCLGHPCAATAGANSSGALIVHADPGVAYTSGRDYCLSEFRDPGSCSSASTRAEATGEAVLIWFIAAFPRNAGPAVNAVQFGIDSTLPRGSIRGSGPCGSMVLELPDADFPGPYSGTLVSIDTEHSTFFPIYWFAVEGESGDRFGSTVYPGDGRAVFVDDDSPPYEDEIRDFGHVSWGSDGRNDCPPAAFEVRRSSWGDVKARYR